MTRWIHESDSTLRIDKLEPMAKSSTSKKGSSLGNANLGVDFEAFLEFLQQASRGLGEIASSLDEFISQTITWMRSIDLPTFSDRHQVELNSETIRNFLAHTKSYDALFETLRTWNIPSMAKDEDPNLDRTAIDGEALAAIRSELLGAIPDEVWAEAIDGFGDPDLANV